MPEGRSDLPEVFAFVGQDKAHFFRPIHGGLENVLQPGDVLVYFRDVQGASKDLYRHVTKGRWHAAVIGEDERGLFRLDSPPHMSGRNLANGLFHILRVRPDIENREKILEGMNEAVKTLRARGYSYDSGRATEAALLDREELWDLAKSDKLWKIYCSELPASVCVMGGLPLPKAYSLATSINRVDEQVIKPLMAAQPNLSREEIVDEALEGFFSNTTILRELGATGPQMNRFRQTEELPPQAKQMKALYRSLFLLPPEARAQAVAMQENFDRAKGQFVGPSDLFDNIFVAEGSLSYVGTYVGRWPSTTESNNELRIGFGGAAGGAGFESLLSHPQGLYSEKLHRLRVYSAEFSPDGKYVLTASEDNTAKIVEVTSGNEITSIEHGDLVRSAKFSPDGKYVVTTSHDKTAKIVEVASGREITSIEHGDSVYSAEFSPDGRLIVTGDSSGGLHLLAVNTLDQSHLENELQTYSAQAYHLESNATTRDQHQAYLRLVFKKAKRDQNMTRDNAIKLMNTYIDRPDYRGWYDANTRLSEGPESHVFGIINAVFPDEQTQN